MVIQESDRKKAERIVRDMFKLSCRYNLNGVNDMIDRMNLHPFVDRNIEQWTIEAHETRLNRFETTFSAN